MRLFTTLCQFRGPQNLKKIPFKAQLPMRLRNYVSGKSDRDTMVPCLQELTILFASLKNNDFNEAFCTKEIEKVQSAHVTHLNKKFADGQIFTKGVVSTGRDLTFRQLNKYLKGYPNPKWITSKSLF